MKYRLCGIFPPRDDIHRALSKEAESTTPCLRRHGHFDVHIHRRIGGSYIAFRDCVDDELADDDGSDYFWFDVDEAEAEAIISSERPRD